MNPEPDDRLVAALRASAAVSDSPPADFGHADVVATSRRITRRRRAVVAAVAGLVVLAGVGTAVALPVTGDGASVARAPAVTAPATPSPAPAAPAQGGRTDAAAPDAAVPRDGVPLEGGTLGAPPGGAPAAPPGATSGGAAPAPGPGGAAPAPQSSAPEVGPDVGEEGPGDQPAVPNPPPSETLEVPCGKSQDPALRNVVDSVFPEAAGRPQAPTTTACRPPKERSVHVEVVDGERRGVLTVLVQPKGGTAGGGASATTSSGQTVTVTLRPDRQGEQAPFADREADLAAKIAARL